MKWISNGARCVRAVAASRDKIVCGQQLRR